MRIINNSRLLIIGCLLLLTLLITACNSNDSDSDSASGDQDNQRTSDVTLDSAKGEVTIPGNTERIIAPFHEDALLALGVKPVAKWSIGQTVQGYLEGQLKEVPKLEWNIVQEQVLKN